MESTKKADLLEKISEVVALNNIYTDEPMSGHTSFRIGGPADFFVTVEDSDELKAVLDICKKEAVDYIILGNGTNVLVRDTGFSGVVVKLGGEFKDIEVQEKMSDGIAYIIAGAGVSLTQLAMHALKKGFSGLEFAHGIPGTVGGAVYMNAGAFGFSIADSLLWVEALETDGSVKRYTPEEMKMDYRKSVFMENGAKILTASFKVRVFPRIPIRVVMERYKIARNEKQPLDLPSAGSFFKRPEGSFAGKLIEDAGLKGYRVGDAGVSEKHAGFIVNYGNATADDVIAVMNHVIEEVKKNSDVTLEPEVIIIG